MSGGDREVRIETDWFGDERQVIYENGEKVGTRALEDSGGILGVFLTEERMVERNNDGDVVGWSRPEQQGGIVGLGAETVEVHYTPEGERNGYSRVEESGGIAGLLIHHESVRYDADGEEVSRTHWESHGGIPGFGSNRVRVTRSSGGSGPLGTGDRGASSSASYAGSGTGSAGGGLLPWVLLLCLVLAALMAAKELKERGLFDTAAPDAPLEYFQDTAGDVPTTATFPASFDCGRAGSWDEFAICGSQTLSASDSELASLYAGRLAGLSGANRVRLVADQRAWLRSRRECERSDDPMLCLSQAYAGRIAALSAFVADEPAAAPEEAAPDIDALVNVAAQTIYVQWATPDPASVQAAERSLSGVVGVLGVRTYSLAIGGISVFDVRTTGDAGALQAEMKGWGWEVESDGHRLIVREPEQRFR